MNKVRLGDIADVSAGGTPARGSRSFWGGGIPWIKISDLKSKYVNSYDETITRDGLENSSAKLFPKGTILYTIFATLGRVGILNINAATNQAIAGIQIKSQAIDPNYLYHFLCSQEKRVNKIGKGVAQKNINLSILRDWMVPLPAINVQKRVSATLDQIRDGIEKNKVSSRLLDEQVKSLFNEMFGDIENNKCGWRKTELFNIANGKASNGFFAKKEDYCAEGNATVLGVVNVVNRLYSGLGGLPKVKAAIKDIEKYSLKYGDMLFCRSSLVKEGIGKASIVPKSVQQNTLFECHVIRLPLDLTKCVPEFVQVLSTTDGFRKQIIAHSKTSTMTTISQEGILRATIILPPIELQKDFTTAVQQIDKLRFNYQRQIEALQELMDKKMEEFFGACL